MLGSQARAETSRDRFAHVLGHLTRPTTPIAVTTAIWEGLELAPLIVDGPSQLGRALEALQKSRIPLVPGEASLALSRLAFTGLSSEGRAADALTAARLAAKAGVLQGGAILGPLPGPGVGAPVPSGDSALGKHGPTGWRPFSEAAPAGPLAIDDLLPSSGDLHAFVRVSFSASSGTRALLLVDTNGPCGAWLDRVELFAWDGERPLTPWQHAVPVELGPGPHELVIRVGHRSESPALQVRLVDARGLLPQGVAMGGAAPPHAAAQRAPIALWDFAQNDIDRGRLGVWSVRDAPQERTAARLFEAAIHARAEPTEAAELHYLLGRVERTDTSRAKAAFLEAQTMAQGHAQALVQLLTLSERQGLAADGDRYARALRDVEPDHPALVAHVALRRLELADAASALPAIERDPRLTHNARLAAAAANLYERAGRLPPAAQAYEALARLTGGASDATQRAVALHRRAGTLDAALAAVDRSIAQRPNALDLRIVRARTLALTADGLQPAILDLEAQRPLHAQSPELEEALGRLLLLAGQRGRAIEALDRALELAPQDRDLADYRRALVAERGLAERWAEPVPALIERAKATPRGRGGQAVSVFERTVSRVYASGLTSQFRQLALRIDAAAAAERHETMSFPYTPGEDRLELLEAEVIRPDGTRLRPAQVREERPEGKSGGVYTLTAYKLVQFPSLAPGDIVHVQLRKDEIGDRNLFGDFFGVFLPLSGEYPKARVEAIIEAPKHRAMHTGGRGIPPLVRSEEGDLQRLTLTMDNVAPIAIEPSMPGYGDVGTWLSVSTFGTWDALAAWYRELIRPQLEVPEALAREIRTLVAPLTTTEARVAAIHGWVVTKTRYVGIEFGIHGFKPYKVAEVVQRGYGDCKDKASLLIALMRTVGIPAELVLIRTRDLGHLEGAPPSLWTFNHAIAYVPALDLYLDGTAETSGLRELPDLDQDAYVMRISPWSDAAPVLTRTPMQSPTDNRVVTRARYALDASGDALVDFTETIAGSTAGRLRSELADPTRRDAILGGILAAQHPGSELLEATYENLEVVGAPVSIRARATLPRLANRSENTLMLPLHLAPGRRMKELTPLQSRQQPLIITALEDEQNTDVYALPAGAKVPSQPPPVVLETPWARWERRVSVSGNEVTVETRWHIAAARIGREDYPRLRQMLAAVARHESEPLEVVLAR